MCPSCGQLVGVNDAVCLNCGRRYPGMMGLTGVLRNFASAETGFAPFVMLVCGVLYIATAAATAASAEGGTLKALFSPSPIALLNLGASGSFPVFGLGRWWTVLSAGWLHANLIHILFNMMSARDLIPLTAHLYGGARTVIIYVLASVAGFAASSAANVFLSPFLPRFLAGGRLTIGASAAIFGLIGAALYYGRRGGSTALQAHAKQWAVGGLLFGFFIPGIDNWAHLGGLGGGYLASRWLDPMTPERGNHVLAALVLLALTGVAVVVSFLTPLPGLR